MKRTLQVIAVATIAGSTLLAAMPAQAFFGPFHRFTDGGWGPWGGGYYPYYGGWGGYPYYGGWGGYPYYGGWGGYPYYGAPVYGYPYAAPVVVTAPATTTTAK